MERNLHPLPSKAVFVEDASISERQRKAQACPALHRSNAATALSLTMRHVVATALSHVSLGRPSGSLEQKADTIVSPLRHSDSLNVPIAVEAPVYNVGINGARPIRSSTSPWDEQSIDGHDDYVSLSKVCQGPADIPLWCCDNRASRSLVAGMDDHPQPLYLENASQTWASLASIPKPREAHALQPAPLNCIFHLVSFCWSMFTAGASTQISR